MEMKVREQGYGSVIYQGAADGVLRLRVEMEKLNGRNARVSGGRRRLDE